MAKLVALLAVILIACGCGRKPSDQLSSLSDEFVKTTLSFSPSAATSAGLHVLDKRNLDSEMDDFSPAALDKQLRFYQDFAARLGKLNEEKLNPEDRADAAILRDQCGLQILELGDVQSYLHNPTLYVETVGNALFSPFILEYAPQPDRIRQITARLQKVPLVLEQGTTNLTTAPLVWTQIAIDENQGNIQLVDKTIRAGVPEDQRAAYAQAATPAIVAMRQFQDFLTRNLTAREGDWRLGRDRYSRKFALALESGVEPDSILESATRDLAGLRAHMLELALPLHRRIAPAHRDHEELNGEMRENQVIGEVLADIAQHHSTRESYLPDARRDLEEARAFVQQKHLLTLPGHANLQVIPTPEFMRGVYTAGGFAPPPPLEPRLEAFYWVTPIPADWPQDKAESKLREYDRDMLQLLTLHEAMPGHYVQFEFAGAIQPAARRALRALYGSGTYVEGWAQYAEQAMLEEGYLNHSPELELTFAKQQLRVMANAILDIRMQMLNMSDRDALDFLEKEAFQERQEAVEKLQRAKATSAQLPMYYVGWRAWVKLREEFQKASGGRFSLQDFHDKTLKEGAVPMPALARLLLPAPQQQP